MYRLSSTTRLEADAGLAARPSQRRSRCLLRVAGAAILSTLGCGESVSGMSGSDGDTEGSSSATSGFFETGTETENGTGTGDDEMDPPIVDCEPFEDRTTEPTTCEIDSEAWCLGCPFDGQWSTACDPSPEGVVGVSADGLPRFFGRSGVAGISSTLIEYGPESEITSLPGQIGGSSLLVSQDGESRVLYAGGPGQKHLLHFQPGASNEITCVAQGPTWVVHAFEEHDGTRVGLVTALRGGNDLILAREDAKGEWTLEELGLSRSGTDLAIADDGTVMVAHHADDPESTGKIPSVLVGDEVFDLGFGAESLLGDMTLVPGASTYAAALRAERNGVRVATPGESAAVVPGTEPAPGDRCSTDDLTNACDGGCTATGRERAGEVAALRDGDDLILVYVETTVDVEGHFEGQLCDGDSEVGCSCEFFVDDDRSTSELVIRRVELPSLASTESLRELLPFEGRGAASVNGAQAGEHVALSITSGTTIHVASLELTATR